MHDPQNELSEYKRFDRHNEDATVPGADYSDAEVRRNRFWNLFVTVAALIGLAAMLAMNKLTLPATMALSVLVLIASFLYRWLFASKTAAKLDEDSAGSGKRVGPVTMGTILGYLNDGFRW